MNQREADAGGDLHAATGGLSGSGARVWSDSQSVTSRRAGTGPRARHGFRLAARAVDKRSGTIASCDRSPKRRAPAVPEGPIRLTQCYNWRETRHPRAVTNKRQCRAYRSAPPAEDQSEDPDFAMTPMQQTPDDQRAVPFAAAFAVVVVGRGPSPRSSSSPRRRRVTGTGRALHAPSGGGARGAGGPGATRRRGRCPSSRRPRARAASTSTSTRSAR